MTGLLAPVAAWFMEYKHEVGGLAGVLTTICFVPQAWHIFRLRETRAISLLTYITYTIGVVFWFWYGLLIDSWPMIWCDGISTLLGVYIIVMKIRLG